MYSDNLPDETGCLVLLKKYGTPQHIVDHSVKVWEVARVLAEGLRRGSHTIDIDLLKTACLLHDIAKFICIEEGLTYHDRKGEEILRAEGLPAVGNIVGQHVILRDGGGGIKEEHVLFYADKRVLHDEVVGLDQRFRYLLDTYGKFPQAEEKLAVMEETTRSLETRIFRLLDFSPDDVTALIESPPEE